MNEKIITVRLNEKHLNMIESIKKHYAEVHECSPDDFTTSQIIKWCIGSKWETTKDYKSWCQKQLKQAYNKTTG